jgi:hypothetical protein
MDGVMQMVVQIVILFLASKNNLLMEIKIFINNQEEFYPPQLDINETLNELKPMLTEVINNVELISFLKDDMTNGK